jgi:predicted SnoaL-like aldol condensation-catalyzing enzyme
MSRIFLSHSSKNNDSAIALRGWLAAQGWNDVFLDLDPSRGIAAGDRWERSLNQAAPEGLKGFLAFLKDKFPNNRSETKHVFADGDFVIVHDHAVREPGTRGSAIVNIYRLENGKIVEHWDVIQPIPEKSANDNGMF